VLLWRKPTPDRVTRDRTFFAAKWWSWDSNRIRQSDGIMLAAFGQFLNYWSFGTQAFFARRSQDSWATRGGPIMTDPGGGALFASAASDNRKRIVVGLDANYDWNGLGGWGSGVTTSIEVKPSSSLRISLQPEFRRSHSLAQYVQQTPDESAVRTFGSRYVFSDLDQTQVSMSTRATWVMKPRMSLQVYTQPLLAMGDYWNFKSLVAPRTFDFESFPGRVGDPDFNFKSLRVNAVYRWEWRLGSTLYVVWTEQRENSNDPGTFAFGRDARALFRAPPDDVFLVKVSYWLSR
jgi:hypothetical protein